MKNELPGWCNCWTELFAQAWGATTLTFRMDTGCPFLLLVCLTARPLSFTRVTDFFSSLYSGSARLTTNTTTFMDPYSHHHHPGMDHQYTHSQSGLPPLMPMMEGNYKRKLDNDLIDDGPPKKRQGRRKIKIEFIEDKSRRQITFSKRKAGIMKKAYELTTLTGTQALLLIASETGHVYTFATSKLQPFVTHQEGKALIQRCLNSSESAPSPDGYSQSLGEKGGTQMVLQSLMSVLTTSDSGRYPNNATLFSSWSCRVNADSPRR